VEIRRDLIWTKKDLRKAKWLRPYLDIPDNASAPLAMTPPHPDAVGSYGAEAIEWIETNLQITLRWWQRLATVRQLEHDKDGRLVWRTILESCPRRSGKSVRLRSMALWRLDHADLFGERQLAIHTGKDVQIVREIHQQAWTWAMERDGWNVRRGAGFEEVYLQDGRWLVRSMDAVYGYDVTLGMVDEAWAVPPGVFEEGMEPATMERVSPQLLLTSTAHRRATSLMRKRVSQALEAEDGETLLMLWAAPPGADPADPATWKAASPHWSEDRARTIKAKYTKALLGEAEAEADDPDPMQGFLAQYLNQWRLTAGKVARGNPLVTEEAWDDLAVPVPDRKPDAAAIESWYADGVSLALAWRTPDGVIVSASDHQDLAGAAEAVTATGYRRSVLVGKTLADDPALKGLRVKPMQARTGVVVKDLDRLLSDGVLWHDDSAHLAEQILAIRTVPSADGSTVSSKGRADAVKAAGWAAAAARTRTVGSTKILLPTSA
jgi:hypothetical protein